MKKILLTLSVAALAMTACTNESEEIINNSPQPREITLRPIAQPATRAAVEGTDFTPTSMVVAAYDKTNSAQFFGASEFTKDNEAGTWKGGKYWPFEPAYINFLAYSELTGTAGDLSWGSTENHATWPLTMTDNSTEQKDLMYAIGHGEVTGSSPNLTFPTTSVQMQFKHAQAWISFMANAEIGNKITLNSITLNGASYAGTYTLDFENYNAEAASQSVSGVWTSLGAKGTDNQSAETSVAVDVTTPNEVTVPGWTAATAIAHSEGDGVSVGDGLLIVPDNDNTTADFVNFVIDFSLDGRNYTYTYTPATAAAGNVEQGKHYIYKINFHLHEIAISPIVTDWTDVDTSVNVHQ